MSEKDPIDWATRALTRRLRSTTTIEAPKAEQEEVEPPCEHVFVPGKKHCRLCGERELSVWLDKQVYLKRGHK